MPAARDAERFEPMAYVHLPKRVSGLSPRIRSVSFAMHGSCGSRVVQQTDPSDKILRCGASTFSEADSTEVASRRTVVVFNIAGKKFRLIAAIHYDIKKVFVLRFMTHAEYSKGKWKEEL